MDNIPRIPGSEVVYGDEKGTSGRKLKLRAEQKNIDWMMDIISKFTKPGDIVVDMFSGTFPTAKACMKLDKHRRFVGCDLDYKCIKFSMESLVRTYAEQLLNPSSDIEGNDELVADASSYLKGLSRLDSKTERDLWNAPAGFPPVQVFPDHVAHFTSAMFNDFTLYRSLRGLPLNQWGKVWVDRFHSLDCNAILAHEQFALGVRLSPSSIPGAGIGVFAMKNFGKGEKIGWYYGTLVYRKIGSDKSSSRVYGSGHMEVSPADFKKWTI